MVVVHEAWPGTPSADGALAGAGAGDRDGDRPELHALHWSREQAVASLRETGQYPQAAEDRIDRIAVMPGQLTAYDSGALAIRALRKKAEAALGCRFELRAL